jgi:hypothetical protein
MTLREYNNQILLTIPDSKPINDDSAKKRENSLRLLAESTNVNKWFECRDACLNNPDCAIYKFDENKPLCQIFRKEPYKEIKDLSLADCTMFCSKDNDCDYLAHSNDNTCLLHTREQTQDNNKNNSRSAIGDLWFDYPIYGLNLKKGTPANNFDECRKKLGHDYFVYYDDAKYCVPKRFFEQSFGDTVIYFNKRPVDKYKILNNFIGLKSKNRESIDYYKTYVVIIWIIILIISFYFLARKY